MDIHDPDGLALLVITIGHKTQIKSNSETEGGDDRKSRQDPIGQFQESGGLSKPGDVVFDAFDIGHGSL